MKKKGKKSGLGLAGARSRPHWALTGALVASTVMSTGLAKTANAQGGIESRPRHGQAAHKTHDFNIPAGSLSDALKAYESVTGLRIDLKTSIEGKETQGVSGNMTPHQALQRLLHNTGLMYVFAGRNTVVVRDRGSQAEAVLEGVSVTGNAEGKVSSPKYTQDPVDIPQTITVISSETMDKQGVVTLRDALRNVPGISLNAGEGGNSPGDKFNIRGFTAENDVFIDGVRDASVYGRETFNLEQVEVTKGPNSTISGRGTTGGAINLVTKTPHAVASRSANISVGTDNLRRMSVDINQPLPNAPTAAFRINAARNEYNTPGSDNVSNKQWGIAPSLAVGLGTPTQAMLSYSHSRQDNTPAYGASTFNEVPDINTRRYFGLRGLDFEKSKSNLLTFRVDHDFGVAKIRNQTTRSHSEVNRIVTLVRYPDGARSPKSHINDNAAWVNQTNLTTSFRTGPVRHSVATGFEFGKEDSKRGNYSIDNSAIGPYPAITDWNNPTANTDYVPSVTPNISVHAKSTSMGAYLFETMELNKYVQVDGGVRWDSYDPKYVDSASAENPIKAKKSTAVTGRAALVVKPASFASVYASYGTSFNPSNEKLSHDRLNEDSALDPEKSRSYEVGSKWSLFKERLLASFALFRTEKINARTSDPDDPDLGTVLQGKQRSQGAEAGFIGNITPKWNVNAGYSFLEAKYVESLNEEQEGSAFTNVPKHSVTLWTTYQITPALNIGGGARYQDKRQLRGTTWIPSYHTYDATASYRLNSQVDLQFNLRNLTDELYYDSGRMWTPAPGRSFSMGTTFKF